MNSLNNIFKIIKLDLFYKIIFILLIINILFLLLYIIFLNFIPQILYFFTMIFFGFFIFKYNNEIKLFLNKFQFKNQYIFPILIGYVMVLFEEFFAAIFNHMSENFSFSLLILRIFQFQFFNIIAFTGVIISLTYLLKKYEFSKKELFIFIGIFSVISENLFTNLFNLLSLSIINGIVYFIIFYPIYLGTNNLGTKKINIFYKLFLFLIIIFLITIFTSSLIDFLRTNWPILFPPINFIPL